MAFEEVIIGNARLIHGDCREVLPLLPPCDLLLTDPPYGLERFKTGGSRIYKHADEKAAGLTWDVCVPHWLMLMMQEQAAESIVWGGNYYTLGPARCVLVWDKQNDGRDFADCEMAWTSIDAVARIFRKRPMNMDGGKEHPTQKPIDLMLWCIDKVAHAQTVRDPFMGSGTTGVACAMHGRAFTGIERERKYFDIACERISRAQAQGTLLPPEPPRECVQAGLL